MWKPDWAPQRLPWRELVPFRENVAPAALAISGVVGFLFMLLFLSLPYGFSFLEFILPPRTSVLRGACVPTAEHSNNSAFIAPPSLCFFWFEIVFQDVEMDVLLLRFFWCFRIFVFLPFWPRAKFLTWGRGKNSILLHPTRGSRTFYALTPSKKKKHKSTSFQSISSASRRFFPALVWPHRVKFILSIDHLIEKFLKNCSQATKIRVAREQCQEMFPKDTSVVKELEPKVYDRTTQ